MPGQQLVLPLKNAVIDSTFGPRMDPIDKNKIKNHNGVDFQVGFGTEVHSVFAGTVVAAVNNKSYNPDDSSTWNGNYVRIQSGAAVAVYLHLNDIIVAQGDTVAINQVIGHTGSTGRSTGPHLHFTLLINGIPVDPVPYFNGQTFTVLKDNGNVGSTSHGMDTPAIVNKPRDYEQLITVDSNDIVTLQDFITKHSINIKPADLLNYKNNQNKIFNAYEKANKVKYGVGSVDYVAFGTKISVPLSLISTPNPYLQNQTLVENQPYVAFIESEIKKLIFDPRYKKLNINNSDTNTHQGSVYKKLNKSRIWLWSKTLAPNGEFLLDISPFVQNVRTSVTENGGNFTISLPHITYTRSEKGFDINVDFYDAGNWGSNFVSKNSSHEFQQLVQNLVCDTLYAIDDNNELKNNNVFAKRKNSFFNTIISENDLFFITFEPLELDNRDYDTTANFFRVTVDQLNNKVFDMICLADAPMISAQGEESREGVSVSGRDLIKLVIDDGVYFFPVEYAVQHQEQIIKNANRVESSQRLLMQSTVNSSNNQKENETFLLGDNSLVGDRLFYFDKIMKVEDWITFIFSQLVHERVVPEALFNGYTDKTFVISKTDLNNKTATFNYKRVLAKGIWQCIKLVFDNNITNRLIGDSSLATDTGSLLNLIRKVAQKPFVELISDTYSNKYYFMFRKPPFSEQSFKSNKCINIFDSDTITDTLYKCNEVYTWYRLTATGSIIDNTDSNSMINLPAVLLPEYVDIFGMKILDVQSNYLDFLKVVGDGLEADLNRIIQQGREDLDWLIETNAYLPFTRMGTINIKQDRRIKRGMCIRYFPTGEVFYVDEVTHSSNYQNAKQNTQNTTLTVSRGIIEKHYDKYFSVVRLLRNSQNEQKWTVNKDVFNFLIQNKQWDV